MPPFGSNYNPSAVALGSGGAAGPYLDLWGKKPKPLPTGGSGSVGLPARPMTDAGGSTPGAAPSAPNAQPPAANILAPESIRATGTGPFDSAYRQNLATYAGGQFSRPGGSMSFNPTDVNTFPGQPTGGGTAPITGMPQTLLDTALSGQGFSWTPPQPPAATKPSPGDFSTLQDWMQQFLTQGRNGRMGAIG